MNKIEWCLEQHRKINHMYDGDVPYSLHLRLTAKVYEKYKHLLDDKGHYFNSYSKGDESISLREACGIAVWGHDLIENCHVTYNDVVDVLGREAAEIIYAVSDDKGRTRRERANSQHFADMRNCKGAVFVKLCDRIANVKYGLLLGTHQLEMYRKENPEFVTQLGGDDIEHELVEMFDELLELLEK